MILFVRLTYGNPWALLGAHWLLGHVYGNPFNASIDLFLPSSARLPWTGHFSGNAWEVPKWGEPPYKDAQLHLSFSYKRTSRSWDVGHEGSQDTELSLGEAVAVAECITLPKPWPRRCSPAQLPHLLHLASTRSFCCSSGSAFGTCAGGGWLTVEKEPWFQIVCK